MSSCPEAFPHSPTSTCSTASLPAYDSESSDSSEASLGGPVSPNASFNYDFFAPNRYPAPSSTTSDLSPPPKSTSRAPPIAPAAAVFVPFLTLRSGKPPTFTQEEALSIQLDEISAREDKLKAHAVLREAHIHDLEGRVDTLFTENEQLHTENADLRQRFQDVCERFANAEAYISQLHDESEKIARDRKAARGYRRSTYDFSDEDPAVDESRRAVDAAEAASLQAELSIQNLSAKLFRESMGTGTADCPCDTGEHVANLRSSLTDAQSNFHGLAAKARARLELNRDASATVRENVVHMLGIFGEHIRALETELDEGAAAREAAENECDVLRLKVEKLELEAELARCRADISSAPPPVVFALPPPRRVANNAGKVVELQLRVAAMSERLASTHVSQPSPSPSPPLTPLTPTLSAQLDPHAHTEDASPVEVEVEAEVETEQFDAALVALSQPPPLGASRTLGPGGLTAWTVFALVVNVMLFGICLRGPSAYLIATEAVFLK